MFTRQSFTDGGIFDNLGVRAFRFIERCWGEDCNPGEAAHREVQIEQLSGSDTGRLADGAGAATAPKAARAAAELEHATAGARALNERRCGDGHGSGGDCRERSDGRERDVHDELDSDIKEHGAETIDAADQAETRRFARNLARLHTCPRHHRPAAISRP